VHDEEKATIDIKPVKIPANRTSQSYAADEIGLAEPFKAKGPIPPIGFIFIVLDLIFELNTMQTYQNS
jgi:hypothetical protein